MDRLPLLPPCIPFRFGSPDKSGGSLGRKSAGTSCTLISQLACQYKGYNNKTHTKTALFISLVGEKYLHS